MTGELVSNVQTTVVTLQSVEQTIVSDPGHSPASVLTSAEQGPPGPAGGGSLYQHPQTTPSDLWTINHNFGRYAHINIYSPGGVAMWAEVVQATNNQCLIYFDSPQTGFALCT